MIKRSRRRAATDGEKKETLECADVRWGQSTSVSRSFVEDGKVGKYEPFEK